MAPNDGSNLSSHPLFYLRRFMIICDAIGIAPALFVITTSRSTYMSSEFGYVLFWLLASITLSCWDLIDWKLKQAASLMRGYQPPNGTPLPHNSAAGDDDDNDNDHRPRILILLLDLILSFAFAIMFLGVIVGIQDRFSWRYNGYNYNELQTIIACTYGSVSQFVNAICHVMCFWKQLMARKKNGWERAIGLKRKEWQDQLNRFLDSAAQFVADPNHPDLAHGRCGGRCGCASYAEDIAHLVKREKQLVEKLMEAMGKSSGYPKMDNGYEEVVEADRTPAADHHEKGKGKARDILESDVEAGLTYQHEALKLLTPSSSATDNDVEAAARPYIRSPETNNYGRQDRYQTHSSVQSINSVAGSIDYVGEHGKGSSSRK